MAAHLHMSSGSLLLLLRMPSCSVSGLMAPALLLVNLCQGHQALHLLLLLVNLRHGHQALHLLLLVNLCQGHLLLVSLLLTRCSLLQPSFLWA